MGLPGLPSLTGFAGGPAGCGEKAGPGIAAPTLYAGWMEDRRGANYQLSGIFLGVASFDLNHQYPLRGTWFGLSETITFGENLGAIASGWVLVQANNTHTSELEGSPDDLAPFEWERTPTKMVFCRRIAQLPMYRGTHRPCRFSVRLLHQPFPTTQFPYRGYG